MAWGHAAVPLPVGVRRSRAASGGYILHHTVIIPMPPFQVSNIQQVRELGIDAAQEYLEISAHNASVLQAVLNRQDQVPQAGGNNLQRQVLAELAGREIYCGG